MKEKEKQFISEWFFSDLNIEIEIRSESQKGIIILENNAYYFNGVRYKGDKRRVIYDSEYNWSEDEILDFLEKNYKEFLYGEFTIEEIFNFLEELEENEFKVEVL